MMEHEIDRELLEKLRAHVEAQGYTFFELSAATHQGTRDLVKHAAGMLSTLPPILVYEADYVPPMPEIGTAEEIYYDPRHPYTWGLMQSLPALNRGAAELKAFPGMPPTLIDPPVGDAFACRNEYALEIDYHEQPPMFKITDTHYAATWLLDPRAPKIERPMGGRRNV